MSTPFTPSVLPQLESLQQTRGQLLKVSEQISCSMRSSQEQLNAKLQQTQKQLEDAKARGEQTRVQLDQTLRDLDYTRSQASHLQIQLEQSQVQLEESRTRIEQMRIQQTHLEAHLEQLQRSAETSMDSLLIKVLGVSLMSTVGLWGHLLTLCSLWAGIGGHSPAGPHPQSGSSS